MEDQIDMTHLLIFIYLFIYFHSLCIYFLFSHCVFNIWNLHLEYFYLRESFTINSVSFIIHFRDKCSKQNMKNTFWENVFVCENFLSTVKKASCIENIRFFGESMENANALPILEIEQNGWFHWISHD